MAGSSSSQDNDQSGRDPSDEPTSHDQPDSSESSRDSDDGWATVSTSNSFDSSDSDPLDLPPQSVVTDEALDLSSLLFDPHLLLSSPVPPPWVHKTDPIKHIGPRYRSVAHFAKCVPKLNKRPTDRPAKGKGRGRATTGGSGKGQGRLQGQSRLVAPTPRPSTSGAVAVEEAQPQPSTSKSSAKKTEEMEKKTKGGPEGKEKKTEDEEKTKEALYYPMPGRKFLAHQMPVHRPRKQQPNVMTLMNSEKGPLAAFNSARLQHRRIKVWTRNAEGIRGFCVGLLDAFDKHWNLSLRNVEEEFLRKRNIKFPAATRTAAETPKSENEKKTDSETSKSTKVRKDKGTRTMNLIGEGHSTLLMFRNLEGSLGLEGKEKEEENLSQSQMRKKRLVVLDEPFLDGHGNLVVAVSRKYELVKRHVHQLFLMGDQIVFVEMTPPVKVS